MSIRFRVLFEFYFDYLSARLVVAICMPDKTVTEEAAFLPTYKKTLKERH